MTLVNKIQEGSAVRLSTEACVCSHCALTSHSRIPLSPRTWPRLSASFKGVPLFPADRPGGERVAADPGRPGLCAERPAGGHGAAPGEGGGEEAAAAPGGRGQEPGEPPDEGVPFS